MSSKALSERLPTIDEAERALEATAALTKALTKEGTLPIKVSQDDAEVQIELPPAIGDLVMRLLGHIANNEMVTFIPYGAELTTQKAADLLNVSRPFLIKLLDQGEINHHKVGTHRKIKLSDLLEYKKKRDGERAEALQELQRLGQEFDAP